MTPTLRSNVLSQFSCLGDRCADTCCKGWSMQLDEPTLAHYKKEAPELLAAVEPAEETPWIMRKDPHSGYCVKLEGGLCGIHKQYGDALLGDACHFYPRSTRALGEHTVMTATLSCPEITRLALFCEEVFMLAPAEIERLPHRIKNYLPDGTTGDDALGVHQAFLAACDAPESAEKIFARIASASRSLVLIDRHSWAQAAAFYVQHADGRLPEAETNINDPFNLLHALAGLMLAVKKPMPERLQQTVSEMEKALAVKLDWQNVLIYTSDESLPAYARIQTQWKSSGAKQFDIVLKKYLQMQLSLALYPFGGFGGDLIERITIIGVRFATIKLALMSACSIGEGTLPQEVVVRVVQSISRFLDHLGDPTFSLQIYAETGWNRESRMLGLLA